MFNLNPFTVIYSQKLSQVHLEVLAPLSLLLLCNSVSSACILISQELIILGKMWKTAELPKLEAFITCKEELYHQLRLNNGLKGMDDNLVKTLSSSVHEPVSPQNTLGHFIYPA